MNSRGVTDSMSQSAPIEEMLRSAGRLVAAGEVQSAADLLKIILRMDIHCQQAWKMLYSLQSNALSLEDFQLVYTAETFPGKLGQLLTARESQATMPIRVGNIPPAPPAQPAAPPASPPAQVIQPQNAAPAPQPAPPVEPVYEPGMMKFCPECGHTVPPGSRFCGICGRSLYDRPDAQPAPQPAAPVIVQPNPPTQPVVVQQPAPAIPAPVVVTPPAQPVIVQQPAPAQAAPAETKKGFRLQLIDLASLIIAVSLFLPWASAVRWQFLVGKNGVSYGAFEMISSFNDGFVSIAVTLFILLSLAAVVVTRMRKKELAIALAAGALLAIVFTIASDLAIIPAGINVEYSNETLREGAYIAAIGSILAFIGAITYKGED